MLDDYTEPLKTLDWNDPAAVQDATSPVLARLADDPTFLTWLLDEVPNDPELFPMAEHYDILDKVVLHNDPSGWRLRLHLFLPGYYDRPHNHRWTYSSRILAGSYQHTLYGPDHDLDERVDVAAMQPYMVRTETAGSAYTLHHSMIHAAVAEPHTVSLIIRGPAMKDRFLVADRATNTSWWQHGAAEESAEKSREKRMTVARFTDFRDRLTSLGLAK
ncbi:hypothetical protein [Streptomyces xanthochromogenes]|uniref:Phytanoyl-CoA dioxygenase family protein n=1 Tax=Streptomyces xanthochromogenes TaxID=67384 RepID=A0ABQ2ZHT1_9ACTN|nr:hypothetical protein [Streptomyces xanthochromogenes]GGY13551.1 hypothetical protein GCM10010326_01050 [Streptomyces xanthochromogenes]